MRVGNCEYKVRPVHLALPSPRTTFFKDPAAQQAARKLFVYFKYTFSLSVLKHSLLRLQPSWSPHGALRGSRIRLQRLNRSPLNSSFERPSTDKNLVFRRRLSGSLTSKNSMNSKAESARNLKTIFVGIGSI
jgi:hypothetical protein